VLSFDGVDDYVEVPHSDVLNPDEITVEVCLKLKSLEQSDFAGVVWRGEVDADNISFVLKFNNGPKKFSWDWKTAGTWYSCLSPVTEETLSWIILVGTYDGDEQRLYRNGVLVKRKSGVPPYPKPTDPLRIGRYYDHYLNAYIAFVRIYNRALSEDEVRWNYLHPDNPVRDGLVLWLKMDEGEGTKVFDCSGNDNDGTIHGATWAYEKAPAGLDHPTGVVQTGAIVATKIHSDLGTTGDRILATSDTMFETTSTSYQLAWTVQVEALEDVKNVIEYVKAQIRVGPSSGGGSPPPPDSEISCPA